MAEYYSLRSVILMSLITLFLAIIFYELPEYYGDGKSLFFLLFVISGFRSLHMGLRVRN